MKNDVFTMGSDPIVFQVVIALLKYTERRHEFSDEVKIREYGIKCGGA
jgi:hypothetical protein